MRSKKYKLNIQRQEVDSPLLMTVVFLVFFGLIMVYDSSVVQSLKDHGDQFYYIKQQLIWVVLGIVSAFILSNFDYHKLKKISLPMVVVSFLLLLSVFIPGIGVLGGGAHRWLNLGFFTLQPAEIIKLTGVIFLAALFENKTKLIPFLILVGSVACVTAILQKDLGSTIVFVLTCAFVYFVAKGPIWHFLVLLPAGILSFLGLVVTSPYRVKRILAFLDPFSDTQGFTYHISQVLIALGSGGFLGLGLGQSRQKFEYIPEVTTDSIFAIVGEELGFLGGLLIILLFTIFMVRGLKIATGSPDNFGKILAAGITCWITIQAVINLSAMVALMPLTGVPLPFISYGGSALVANLTAVGILLNISKRSA